jgi:hypothetical protein
MRTNVSFDSAGIEIAGHLYTPDDSHAGPRPAIVVGHTGSGVKEQAAGLYALPPSCRWSHCIPVTRSRSSPPAPCLAWLRPRGRSG